MNNPTEHPDDSHPDTDRPADSLDLLAEQDRVLTRIFAGWDDKSPENLDGTSKVEQAWDRGRIGKLLIEHAAVRVAAKEDVASVLRDSGQDRLCAELTAHLQEVRTLLDRLDELARGVAPVAVAASGSFAATVERLAEVVRDDLGAELAEGLDRVGAALGGHRSDLRSANFVTAHAPSHPGSEQAWYDDIPVLARVHARYDRLRGFPWAESNPFADTAVADDYNPDS